MDFLNLCGILNIKLIFLHCNIKYHNTEIYNFLKTDEGLSGKYGKNLKYRKSKNNF